MQTKYFTNDKGLGLIELIISALIMLIILAGTIKVFTYQQSLIQDENDTAKVRAKGRYAVKLIAKEVRMAGYGLPPFQAITNSNPLPATVNTLSFRSNLENVRTMMDPTSSGASKTDNSIPIVPGIILNHASKIVIHNPNDDVFDRVTVMGGVSATDSTIDFNPGLKENYTFFSNAKVVTVNKYNNYTIFQDGNQISKTIDGVTTPIINDLELSPNGLTFDFNGATDTQDIRIIGITLNMQDPKNSDAFIEFQTDVTLRNSGT